MAKETSNFEASTEKKRAPLDAFVHHQKAAIEETGKALASLLPKDFRKHTGKALDESVASWNALFEGMIDGIEQGLDKLRPSSKEDAGDEGTSKVKVEVD